MNNIFVVVIRTKYISIYCTMYTHSWKVIPAMLNHHQHNFTDSDEIWYEAFRLSGKRVMLQENCYILAHEIHGTYFT
jgi:hypothetical protein